MGASRGHAGYLSWTGLGGARKGGLGGGGRPCSAGGSQGVAVATGKMKGALVDGELEGKVDGSTGPGRTKVGRRSRRPRRQHGGQGEREGKA